MNCSVWKYFCSPVQRLYFRSLSSLLYLGLSRDLGAAFRSPSVSPSVWKPHHSPAPSPPLPNGTFHSRRAGGERPQPRQRLGGSTAGTEGARLPGADFERGTALPLLPWRSPWWCRVRGSWRPRLPPPPPRASAVSLPFAVGQCGNQVGCRFWDLALREHAAVNKVRAALPRRAGASRPRCLPPLCLFG